MLYSAAAAVVTLQYSTRRRKWSAYSGIEQIRHDRPTGRLPTKEAATTGAEPLNRKFPTLIPTHTHTRAHIQVYVRKHSHAHTRFLNHQYLNIK